MVITAQDVAALRKKIGVGMMDCKKALIEAEGNVDQAIYLLRKKGEKVLAARASHYASEGAVFARTSVDNRYACLAVLNCETDFSAKSDFFLELGKKVIKAALIEKPNTILELESLSLGNETIREAIVAATGTIGEKITISVYETLAAPLAVSYIHLGNRLAVLVGLNSNEGDHVVGASRDIAMQIAAMAPLAIDKDQIDPSIVEKETVIIHQQIIDKGFHAMKAEKITQGRLHKFFQENTLLQQPFIKNTKLTVSQYLQSIASFLTVTSFKRISLDS